MQVLTINLGGTGSGREVQAFDIAGRYFEILESLGPVTVAFYDANGTRAADLELRRVDSGFYVVGPFHRFEVLNDYGTAQALRVAYGSGTGGSRRQPGNVVVVDAIGDRVQTLTTGSTAIGVGQVETLVSPALNVNGLILRAVGAAARAGSGGTSQVNVLAAKTLPSSTIGTERLLLAGVLETTGSTNRTIADFDLAKRFPPGWGLYAIRDITTAVAGDATATVSYELL